MTLAQVSAVMDEQFDINRRAQQRSSRGPERPATLADAAMLARLGLSPPPG